MRTRRFLGMAMVGISGAVTVVAGIGLAASPTETLGTLLVPAIAIFLLVSPMLLFGVYWVVRDDNAPNLPELEMEKPLALVDMLKEHQEVGLKIVTEKLGVSSEDVLGMVTDLARLGLFTGYIASQGEGRAASVDNEELLRLSHCKVCSQPLQLTTSFTICSKCQTAYFLN